jgi:NADPH-dependent 7-cyano-7-deazaguanine reductase QueF
LSKFENGHPQADYLVEFFFDRFQSLCPVTKKPDVGTLLVRYKPGHWCLEGFDLIELAQAFREQEKFHEVIVNEVFQALAEELNPKFLEVVLEFPLYSRCEGNPVTITLKRSSCGDS